MSVADDVREMLALTRKYYARLRELLAQAPADKVEWRCASENLSICETLRHVCAAERWYMNLIDGGSREASDPAADHEALLAALTETEAQMLAFLESMDEVTLETTAEVPGWWGEGKPQSARLILMHSLAHKYYHCGQLQSILHTLADAKPTT
jgi:uncharacterized damage-inducible protein DinB